jgi:ABC-type dipeptide/oligopeptide/nickel transport system permease component
MRSAITFLGALLLLLLAFSAYIQIVLVGKLPGDPSTFGDIISQAIMPFFVAAAIVLPWRMIQSRRGKISPMPMLVALAVVGLWQYQTYSALKESIGQ